MDDIPWLYVAMIFIAFLSWVHNRIQESKEHRRTRKIEKERAARARRTTAPPEFESPYRPSSPPQKGEESSAPKTFREVFEDLQREFTEPEAALEEPSPSRIPVPPPLPAEPIYEQPVLPDGPVRIAPPLQGKKRRRGSRNTGTHLIRTLRHGGKLKTALILKEVIDKPRALRPR